jgi:L-ascorbate metabolism protein UlaG (beta-lactamase superfamily)
MKTFIKFFIVVFFTFLSGVNSIHSQVKKNELQITNLANEGFMLQSSTHKILIDALFTDGYGLFAVPPKGITNQIMEAGAPFDSINLLAVTHYHKDHCDPALINKYLDKYKTIRLVTNKPSLVFIDGCCFGFIRLIKQFYDLTPGINQTLSAEVNSIPVKVFGLKHLSFVQNGINLEEYMYNSGFLFDLDGIMVFHSGDCDRNSLEAYLAENKKWTDRVDVAFLNNSFFESGKTDLDYIIQTLNPRYIIVMHVPPSQMDEWLNKVDELKKFFPNIQLFKNPGEIMNLNLRS